MMDNTIESIINFFKIEYPYLQLEDMLQIAAHSKIRTLEPGETLVKFNQIYGNVVYVVEGLLKAFYINQEGAEVIYSFEQEGSISGNWYQTLLKRPSTVSFQAIETTLVAEVDIQIIETIAAENINIARAYNSVMKKMLADTLLQLTTFINEKPEARYLLFLEENPKLQSRVSQKNIASYLGISPVSLSRIKKRLNL